MAEIGPAMGVTWASVQDRQMSVWLPDEGQVTKHVILTYSRRRSGAPRTAPR